MLIALAREVQNAECRMQNAKLKIESGKLKIKVENAARFKYKLMFIGLFVGALKASLREGGGTRSVTEGACEMSE